MLIQEFFSFQPFELTFKIDRALEKGLAVLKVLDKLRDQKK